MPAKKFNCTGCGIEVTPRNLGSATDLTCAMCASDKNSQKLKDELAEHRRKKAKKQEAEEQKKREALENSEEYQKAQFKRIERQEEAKKELARRELARNHIIPFIVRFKPTYKVGWVHKVFAAELEKFFHDVEAGKQPRLMVFVPPRHGKSEIISNNFPSWVLGRRPDWEIIMASYTVNLPLRFSRANRSRLKEKGYKAIFPDTALDPDSTSAEEWLTTQRGGLKCSGVGGGLSGFGANVLIIDDPIKDYEDAQSATIRETAKNWYTTVAETRLAPDGGVIVVQCMVGETPVLLPDGSEKRLDEIRPGDEVATYKNGRLASSKVLNWTSQGHDDTFVMTTSLGRTVQCNARHPFLAVSDAGALEWTRLKDLRLGQRIVTLKDSGGNGKVRRAKKRTVTRELAAGVSAHPITISGNGPRGTAPLLHSLRANVSRILNIGMESPPRITTAYLRCKRAVAQCANYLKIRCLSLNIGNNLFASTIATTQMTYEGSFVTPATSCLNEGTASRSLSVLSPTSDFTTQTITKVEPAGRQEVFDIQVEDTENFIADVIVSHNTRWHDDDLSGWQLRNDKENRLAGYGDEFLQNWRVVSFPAVAETNEYIDPATLDFYDEPGLGRVLVRPKGGALHPERYSLTYLERKRINMPANQWNALFQQNPVPDSGDFFREEDFMYYDHEPVLHDYPVLFSWDLAIGEKRNNDYTVGFAGVVIPKQGVNCLYLLDMYRNRVRDLEQIEAIVSMYAKYKRNAYRLGVEQGTIWLAIEKRLKATFEERDLTPVFDETLVPVRDKRVRATPLQGWMQNHRIYFPRSQPWVSKAREELLRFDAGVNDDVVDSLAWLVRMVQNMPVVEHISEKRRGKSVKELLSDYARDQRDSGNGYMAA